jgi:PhnB protein
MQLNPYLFFNGNCETAFKFYAQCLNAKIKAMLTHAGSPAEQQTPPEWRDKILHAALEIGGNLLMASDAPPEHYHKPQGFSVHLAVDSVAEADRIFQALAENGKILMPINKTFWAERFGMLEDQFGIPWMISAGPQQPPA